MRAVALPSRPTVQLFELHNRAATLVAAAQFRFLERRMGTAKYAAFVLFAITVGWMLRLYLLQAKIADTVASGPYALPFLRM